MSLIHPSLALPSPACAPKADEFRDWFTGFVHEGRNYGGAYFAEFDTRLLPFVDLVRDSRLSAPRILECGCFEGGHTTAMALKLPEAQVTAVDVREGSLERARRLAALRGCGNIRFFQDDLDDPQVAFTQEYDFIYCVGLLYHLRWPFAFLSRCAKAAPRLWLWTVLCAEFEAGHLEGTYRGRLYPEPVEHPLSGVRDTSFFLSLGSLYDMLWQVGYRSVSLRQREVMKDGTGPAVLLCASTEA